MKIEQLYDRLQVSPETLAQFCAQWQVMELALFGSILRSDFRVDSDVDVLVTFATGAKLSLLDLIEMQEQLSALLGRAVDLIEKSAIEGSANWIRRQEILNTTIVIYDETRRSLPA
jgi:uncharacterized protein